MLLTKKFNYAQLERLDHPDGRRYVVGPGRPLPSVTTILAKTKDMSYLNDWIDAVGQKEAERIRNEASTLGTGMHNNLERYILGEPMTGQFMAKALANVIIKKGLSKVDEVWGTEVGLFSAELFAGTTDLVGLHEGIPSIMDFKNSLNDKSKDMIEDYFMQLCAYAIGHNEMYGTTINKGVVMIATRAGKYQEFIIAGDEFTHYETMWANRVCAYYELAGPG